MKENTKVILLILGFNGLMLIIGILIAFFVFRSCIDDQEKGHIDKTDTVKMLMKPIVNNYNFTKPTLYRETTIIYDSTKVKLTKEDSSLIIADYFKRREYSDSIRTDTTMFYYKAIVEKNSLVDMKIKQWYRPQLMIVTKTKEYNYFLIGGSIGYFNKPSFGISASYQDKKLDYGLTYDPFNKGGFITIKKKIKL